MPAIWQVQSSNLHPANSTVAASTLAASTLAASTLAKLALVKLHTAFLHLDLPLGYLLYLIAIDQILQADTT